MLESPFERVKKDHLPIRLLDKGIAHSSYGQQSMRPGQQPLPIMQKSGAIDSVERDRQMLHLVPSHPCYCIPASPIAGRRDDYRISFDFATQTFLLDTPSKSTELHDIEVLQLDDVTIAVAHLFAGDAANNALIGTDADDDINGWLGDDKLEGLAGDDRIDGYLGLDLASYEHAAAAGMWTSESPVDKTPAVQGRIRCCSSRGLLAQPSTIR